VTPSAFKIPSYFYAEVRNDGPDSAKDVEVIADLGKAQADQIDVKPSDKCSCNTDTKGTSIIRVICTDVAAHESVYLYALTSLPIFQKIIVRSSTSVSPIEYSWSDSQAEKENSWFLSSGMREFLKFMTGAVIFVFCVYFVIVVILLMNKIFKI
jgi:hypothetical protein